MNRTRYAPLLLALAACAPPSGAGSASAAAPDSAPQDPLAAELRALARTQPAPVVRRARPAELTRRPALPAVEAVDYPSAGGRLRISYAEAKDPKFERGGIVLRTFARNAQRFRLTTSDPENRPEQVRLPALADGHPHAQAVQALGPDGSFTFARNPTAPQQGTASVALPGGELIVDLTWAELIDRGFGPTWNDLVALGVTQAERERMQPTGEQVERYGHTFEVFAADGVELAWSAELHLPLYVVRPAAGGLLERTELVSLDFEPGELDLKLPHELRPEAERMDFVDWRAKHLLPR